MNSRILMLTIILTAIAFGTMVLAYTPPEYTDSSGDIKFAHAIHVAEQGIDCRSCHTKIDSSKLALDDNYPAMTVCGDCHDEVNDEDKCGICHRNSAEPSSYSEIKRAIQFSHTAHLTQKLDCSFCHNGIDSSNQISVEDMPKMSLCLDCHDNIKADSGCKICHSNQITLGDIHPVGWRNEHGDRADTDGDWCLGCHKQNSTCVECHRGDNLTAKTHASNYEFSHGLDAKSKSTDCRKCHDETTFCDNCHIAKNRMPLRHSLLSWRVEHGVAAQSDPENCTSCHDAADPTCARVGCHTDFDGVRGNAPKIHRDDSELRMHGPWHSDPGYFCFQCHTNTSQAGSGFCGYCHDQD
jgi:predicted CXXCH cytochrome family protein